MVRRSSRHSGVKQEPSDEDSGPQVKREVEDEVEALAVKQESSADAGVDATSTPTRSGRGTKRSAKGSASSTRSKAVKIEADVKDEDADASPSKKSKKGSNASPKKDLTAQKLAKLQSYASTPYPDYARPSAEECERVTALLEGMHGRTRQPARVQSGREGRGAACGEVPSVLDALVRTILSQNTTSKNSTQAKRDMDKHFGGPARWAAIDAAPVEELEDAIRVAGLAPSKARTIKGVLSSIRERNAAEATDGADSDDRDEKNPVIKKEEDSDPDAAYSLDYLHSLPDDACMRSLVSHKGVGPKTASCVLLFCMRRASFAVDTHVFRLTKALGWVPGKCNARDSCYAHLDARIPAHLKYPLHALLVRHGRQCGRCSAHRRAGLTDPADCPLKDVSRRPKEEDALSDDGNGDAEDIPVDASDADDDVKRAVAKVEAMS